MVAPSQSKNLENLGGPRNPKKQRNDKDLGHASDQNGESSTASAIETEGPDIIPDFNSDESLPSNSNEHDEQPSTATVAFGQFVGDVELTEERESEEAAAAAAAGNRNESLPPPSAAFQKERELISSHSRSGSNNLRERDILPRTKQPAKKNESMPS